MNFGKIQEKMKKGIDNADINYIMEAHNKFRHCFFKENENENSYQKE